LAVFTQQESRAARDGELALSLDFGMAMCWEKNWTCYRRKIPQAFCLRLSFKVSLLLALCVLITYRVFDLTDLVIWPDPIILYLLILTQFEKYEWSICCASYKVDVPRYTSLEDIYNGHKISIAGKDSMIAKSRILSVKQRI
jgi:hypothetical protein